ncbi:1-aminocyclopropane-1-carboxylate oxidase [Exophiala viscosa]|uniref:1-aminocyclopropane-1-carboxylate oxidase n=1 Tax=Exophiala viscosa TaxID=2486360 RepID=A0AAN6DKV2_9EURO|nr:1-aminocyclopropane-1-carboxylate oxidase [Exophiala viscosa]
MASGAPPLLDFSSYYGSDEAAKAKLVDEVRKCCLHNGFFQIIGHRVPAELQEAVFTMSRTFFSLPQESKDKASIETNSWYRGYEKKESQILEAGTAPELKEGYYLGEDLPRDHPYFVNKKLNSGPNMWPQDLSDSDSEEFKSVLTRYYRMMHELARDVLAVLAKTLDLESSYFDAFTEDAVATLRLLHYPPQPKDSDLKLTRGIGAHTDFGAITLLMQNEVDGLQVYEKATGDWLDVEPRKGAYVVNLGNMFMRWSNDKYISNLHRVINKSGRERYSVPFFFSGNPDYVVQCLPNCRKEGEPAKYPSMTVQEAVGGSYNKSYAAAREYKVKAAPKKDNVLISTQPITV